MNLLDEKLKKKLKLFENIDNEFGKEVKLNNKKPKKKKQKNNLPISNLTSEQFDKIYTNFLLDSNKTQNQPSKTTNNNYSHKNSFKDLKIKSNDLNINDNFNMNNNYNKIITPEKNISIQSKNRMNRSKSKDFTNYIPPNDSGNRLYNYGFYIQNKLEKKRKKENDKILKQMTPTILPKSKGIFRDSFHFETRLYYNINDESSDNIYKKKEISKDNLQIYDYKPKLNKKSLEIANKLEPSSQRLTKKKKRYSNDKNKYKDIYNNIYQNSFHSKLNSKSPSEKEHLKKFNDLYNKGIENMIKKDKLYKETKIKKDEEYKNYSFKPKLIKNSPILEKNTIIKATSPYKKNNLNIDLYKKQTDWKKKLENENIRKKEIIEIEKNKDCTFKPEISHLNIQNDEKFIMKNLQQMNDYVNKRREILEKKKEYENYKKKRLGEDLSSFNIKPTIPKKFELKTESRSRSHSKDKIYEDRKNNTYKFINNIKYQRNEINDNYYFNNFNNANNIYNNKIKVNVDINSQQEFINAVNALHYKINDLNI